MRELGKEEIVEVTGGASAVSEYLGNVLGDGFIGSIVTFSVDLVDQLLANTIESMFNSWFD
jgi:hypothetical protein